MNSLAPSPLGEGLGGAGGGQQGKGGDSTPLLYSGGSPSGNNPNLASTSGVPALEGDGPVGVSPKEAIRIIRGMEQLLQGKSE